MTIAISHVKIVLDDSSDFGETEGRDIILDTITLPLVLPPLEVLGIHIYSVRNHATRRPQIVSEDGREFVGFWGTLRLLQLLQVFRPHTDLFWDFPSGPRWAFYSERSTIRHSMIRQKKKPLLTMRSRGLLGFQLSLASRPAGLATIYR